MNAVIFCMSALVIVAIGRWALRALATGVELRAVAVTEWQDFDRFAWDKHCDDAVLLTHEALPDADEIGKPVMWMALETQCADLNDLAEQLGERAS